MVGRPLQGGVSRVRANCPLSAIPAKHFRSGSICDIRLGLTGGQAHGGTLCSTLLGHLPQGGRILADRGYDAAWTRAFVAERGAGASIPPWRNRKNPISQIGLSENNLLRLHI